ncbi:MAG: hypothetical protein OH318_01100 [Candidatus Parvarchaeota archaeon]|nr:hypothetical protein [Candidatus Rehaiarchaeum fermentans]MCW1293684.1 hypothetical protein [Candidatus Rehaiarchaeum fermentans]
MSGKKLANALISTAIGSAFAYFPYKYAIKNIGTTIEYINHINNISNSSSNLNELDPFLWILFGLGGGVIGLATYGILEHIMNKYEEKKRYLR